MEYLVVIDVKTPLGTFLLNTKGRPHGAFDHMVCGAELHPVLLCSEVDWITIAPFVRLTQLRNPQGEDKQPMELVVPGRSILFATPKEALIPAPPAPTTLPAGPLTPAVH